MVDLALSLGGETEEIIRLHEIVCRGNYPGVHLRSAEMTLPVYCDGAWVPYRIQVAQERPNAARDDLHALRKTRAINPYDAQTAMQIIDRLALFPARRSRVQAMA